MFWEADYGITYREGNPHRKYDHGGVAWRVRHVGTCRVIPFPMPTKTDCERAAEEMSRLYPFDEYEVMEWAKIKGNLQVAIDVLVNSIRW